MRRSARRIACAAIAACDLLFATAGAKAQTAFYQATEAEIAGAPGTIIRQESMFGAAANAASYRVPTGRPGRTARRSRSRA
jgi:hypothetical protein